MNSTVKEFIVPGSSLFLLIALVPGVLLLYYRRTLWWGQAWFTALLILYWVMSTPVVARRAADWMSGGFRPIASAEQAQGATAVVVLAAGSSHFRARGAEIDALSLQAALRLLEASRVYRLLGQPWVIVTGGNVVGDSHSRPDADILAERLVALGVPADRILAERKALNTHEHAIYVPDILKAHDIERFVLVTSPTHIVRSMKVFVAAGMRPVASVAPGEVDHDPDEPWWEDYLPSGTALDLSQAAMADLMGLTYYWSRGWL